MLLFWCESMIFERWMSNFAHELVGFGWMCCVQLYPTRSQHQLWWNDLDRFPIDDCISLNALFEPPHGLVVWWTVDMIDEIAIYDKDHICTHTHKHSKHILYDDGPDNRDNSSRAVSAPRWITVNATNKTANSAAANTLALSFTNYVNAMFSIRNRYIDFNRVQCNVFLKPVLVSLVCVCVCVVDLLLIWVFVVSFFCTILSAFVFVPLKFQFLWHQNSLQFRFKIHNTIN